MQISTTCEEGRRYPFSDPDNCCQWHSVEEVEQVIFNLKKKIQDMSQEKLNDLYYQHGYCTTKQREKFLIYLNAVEGYRAQLLSGERPCICCDDAQQLIENTKSAIGYLCSLSERNDFRVDTTSAAEWIINNPKVMPYAEWERILYDTACKVDINPEAIKPAQICRQLDVVFDIRKLSCDVDLPPIETKKIECQAGGQVEINLEKCQQDYEILVNRYSCDFTFSDFVTMVNCGIDNEILTKAYECGLTVEVDHNEVKLCNKDVVLYTADML